MSNELNKVSNYVSGIGKSVNAEPIVVQVSMSGLEIHNIKKGDQIKISYFDGNKYLFVNTNPVFKLDNLSEQNHLIIFGKNLTQDDLDIQGEKGLVTTIELRNPQNSRIYETFVIESERKEEEGPINKIKEMPVKVYPLAGKRFVGLKISGTW